jgi:hypothetical protein
MLCARVHASERVPLRVHERVRVRGRGCGRGRVCGLGVSARMSLRV